LAVPPPTVHEVPPLLQQALTPQCWRINHLNVQTRFRAQLSDQPQRIAVVDAGLIGAELVNDMALAGHQITLLHVAHRPLAAALPAEQSGPAADRVEGAAVAGKTTSLPLTV
jgi:rubredoxin-NAD+ reductase